ncbi:hypothetical protein AGDE_00521 [Angomonas deanei]|uniref:RRM domain-containing protein n=1 Tax=Angomonas deanei TaxID=59799 RepID=A0A7G2C715_9TRYP|nr:hypothetical protein AGDE_00521 [Angomonas deanei]CAD2215379.1 hypothetical protein, conserved [Angomonas deanei]|eukprot:EPY43400.1 hypothetical protein AGDE_00521 [Angomonas deanei]
MNKVTRGSSLQPSIASDCSWSTTENTLLNDISGIAPNPYDSHDEVPLCNGLRSKHWVSVRQLTNTRTAAALKDLFYPYGADEAFIAGYDTIRDMLLGYVGFESPQMALWVVEKMDNYVPPRHVVPLKVQCATLEEALSAHRLAGAAGKDSFPVPAHGLRESIELKPVPVAVTEVIVEVMRSSPNDLDSFLTALFSLSINSDKLQLFQDEFAKQLLMNILERTDRPSARNCGVALGFCYCNGWLQGDPFHLTSTLIHSGTLSTAKAEGICALATTCSSFGTMTKASFWALVGHVASQCDDESVRGVLLTNLRQLQLETNTPSAAPLSVTSKESPASEMHELKDDPRLRTLYFSHLPTHIPQNVFMSVLLSVGNVNKVRVCVSDGYETMFSFVEMQSVADCRAALRLDHSKIMGFPIRVQTARTPIQDCFKEDAVYDQNGKLRQPCSFGQSSDPLCKWQSSQ